MSIAALKTRLESIKTYAHKYRAHESWQTVAREKARATDYTYNPAFEAHGHTLRWIENPKKAGLRFAGYVIDSRSYRGNGEWFTSDKKRGIGWYADNFYDSVYRAVVYRLPAREGKPRFVFGYADPDNDGAALLSFEPCDNVNDAQRWACQVAKRFAEEAREEDAKFQAEQQIESAREEIAEGRKEFLTLCAELRAACKSLADFPAMRSAIESQLRRIVAERSASFSRIDLLTNEPWRAVE